MNKLLKILLLINFIFLLACQKLDQTNKNQNSDQIEIQSRELYLQDLHKNKINELFVLLFKNNLTSNQWKSIFQDTQKLSQNKRKLSIIEGLSDEISNQIRSLAVSENAIILQRLTDSSTFILNWSLNDENCKFLFSEPLLNLVCKPRTLDNPLNGGLPVQFGLINFIKPNPVISDIKTDYLNIVLKKSEAPTYTVQLRLKLESESTTEFWFKGDVIPLETNFEQNPFPFGYAELTTLKN